MRRQSGAAAEGARVEAAEQGWQEVNEMRSRLVRAIICALQPGGVAQSIEENGGIIVPPHLYAQANDLVTMLLTEMRDPTEAMIAAGWRDFMLGPNAYEGPQPEDAWLLMIDEALK